MKTNESNQNRIVRIVLGIILLGLYLLGYAGGGLVIVFVIMGAIALITGIIGFCPPYALIKFSTKKGKQKPEQRIN